MSESESEVPPPPQSGKNTIYVAVGLLLLFGASAAIFFGLRRGAASPPAPPPVRAVPTTREVPAAHPTVGAEIALPLDEPETPDAGPTDDAGAATRPRIRYVTRYVAECPGTLDPVRITTVLRQNHGGLRECYNRELRADSTLRGSVTAGWMITPAGTVQSVSTSGSITRNQGFRRCFESTLSRMRFPQPQGGCVQYQQSFSFTPDG